MKKYIGYISLYYAFIIGYIYFSGNLSNYIVPSMQINCIIASILLLIGGLILLKKDHLHYEFKKSDIILLIPLLFLFIANDGELNTSIVKSKASKMGPSSQTIKKDKQKYTIEKGSGKGIDFDVVDASYINLSSDITYNAKMETIKGKTIRVRGFVVKKDSYLPKGYFAIGKLLTSCCTADSGYGGFIAKYDLSKIKEDHWYEVIGTIDETEDKYGQQIGYINVTSIKEISKKSEKLYAYQCNNYGPNGCEILKTYDYEYKYE